MVQRYMADCDTQIRLEYSPESFTGTELDFALDICTAVQETWGATRENPIIINLPSTVEMTTPNVYADQIEWMNTHFKNRESIILSVHPHNDRGEGVASTELALLAGADRVEGTLFGNGERTGNVDILTVAYNMFSQGINPELNIENVREIAEVYERCTKMQIPPRHPYAGKLVFTAFSGSHQDAINKGMQALHERNSQYWEVPYLPIDPSDIGRQYEPIVRINSQSGKGGVGYILERNYGLVMPPKMREAMGYAAKAVSDVENKELMPEEIYRVFLDKFVGIKEPYQITEVHFKQENGITTEVTTCYRGEKKVTSATGNGRLNAVSNALKKAYGFDYKLVTYQEHALTKSSSSSAIAYVGIETPNGKIHWGAAIDPDIIRASIDALLTAINHSVK